MSGRRRDIMDIRELLRHIRAFRDTWELGIHSYLTYLRPALLVLDDFGLKPLQPPAPEDLYDIINERYEQGSVALTSNRAPGEWPDLFGDPLLASAGLDRLAHHAEVLVITGTSFRVQGRRRLEQEVQIEPES